MSKKHFLPVLSLCFGLMACNSPERTATNFCEAHTQANYSKAHELLSERDQAEISARDYADFTWDKRTFDMRLLQNHDHCSSKITPINEDLAIAILNVHRYGGDSPFTCLLPLVKENEQWRVTGHWPAAKDFHDTITRLRRDLVLSYEDLSTLTNEKYLSNASEPINSFFTKVGNKKQELQASVGGLNYPFCFGGLNPDHGEEMTYRYLIFEDKLQTLPAEWDAQRQRYTKILNKLKEGYTPINTTNPRGVRMDLASSGLVRNKQEGGRTITQIQYRFLFWGKVHGPLSWHLGLFNAKNELEQEGFGKEAELITDFPTFVADAPDLSMAIINMRRLPPNTKKAVITFSEPDQLTKYQVELPLLPEYLENGAK